MKLDFPAAGRNRGPILEVLRTVLKPGDTVLEVGSGSGQHVAYFAEHLSAVAWIPSDPDPRHRASIDSYTEELPNVERARNLDALQPYDEADVILSINVIHISPWPVTLSLLDHARRMLILYGPFREKGEHTAPSNLEFDRGLQAQNPQWGVRDLAEIEKEARQRGFTRLEVHRMPVSNLTVVFTKS